jgi:hypothetical protein
MCDGRLARAPRRSLPGPGQLFASGLALAVLATGGCGWLGLGGEEPAARVPAAGAPAPPLPDALRQAVERDFPDRRVPATRDAVGAGDFDGDGRADFALLLDAAGGPLLAIYLQDARRGFRRAWPETATPHAPANPDAGRDAALRVVRAGSPYLFTRQESGRGWRGNTSSSFRFERDAVVLGRGPARETLLHWDGRRFETLAFGE